MSKRKEMCEDIKMKEEESEQPMQKKNKISDDFLEYKICCENGVNINFTNPNLIIYDSILITTDNVKFYFNRIKLYESNSKKFSKLSISNNGEVITNIHIDEYSNNLNQLLNWICRSDLITRKTWLIKNFDVKDNFHNIIQLIKSSITWECIDPFDACWVLMQKQPLPWPIKIIEEIIVINNLDIKKIAQSWIKKVNEMKVCDIENKSIIIGDHPSELFWNTCISLGTNPIIDDVKIRIAVPLLAILPNVQSIPDNYKKSLVERLNFEFKSSVKEITDIISMISTYGASADFLKYLAITSYINSIQPPTEDKKMSKLEKFCNTPINVKNGGWFRALYDVSKLIGNNKMITLKFTDGKTIIERFVSSIDINNFAKIWNNNYNKEQYEMSEYDWDGYHLMGTPYGSCPRFTSMDVRFKMWDGYCTNCNYPVYFGNINFTKPAYDNGLCRECYNEKKNYKL
jgi:hypothetical protein